MDRSAHFRGLRLADSSDQGTLKAGTLIDNTGKKATTVVAAFGVAFSPAAIVPRSRSSQNELRAKRKIKDTVSNSEFSYRVSWIGCRLCVTRLACLENPRFVKDEASSLQGPPRFSLRLRKGRLPLHPRRLNGPTTIKTLLIK